MRNDFLPPSVLKHLSLKYLIYIVLVLSILISCKGEEKEFYFPNDFEFSQKETYQFIDIKSFKTYDKLIDSIENLSFKGKKAYLKLKNNNTNCNVLVTTSFGECFPPLVKLKNIISISKDSIIKDINYPIRDLKLILKKDLLNFGKNKKYSESPEKLVISIVTDLKDLEQLMITVTATLNEIQTETLDSLNFNLYLNRSLELYQLPLPNHEK